MTPLSRLVPWLGLVILGASSAGAATFVVQPGFDGEDTAPYSFLPALSRGTRETLYAFNDPEDGHSFETFVRFDLPLPLIEGDEPVAQAFLALFYGFDFTEFGDANEVPGTIECREVLEAWNETDLTWINRPAVGDVVDRVEGIDELGAVLCDVTPLVSRWLDGEANHGIAVTNPTARLLGFYSFEANVEDALRPTLLVETVPGPGGAAATSSALGAVWWLARCAACRKRQHRWQRGDR